MENLPFPDEIILKTLNYLSVFDLTKCAQVCKGLNKICEDKEFQQYHELKKLFKNSNLKLTRNDSIMVNITDEEATKNINKALELNGIKIELILKRTFIRKKDASLIIQEDYFSKLLDNRYPSGISTATRRRLIKRIVAIRNPKPKNTALRCLLHVKSLVICFYLGWSSSTLPIRTNMI